MRNSITTHTASLAALQRFIMQHPVNRTEISCEPCNHILAAADAARWSSGNSVSVRVVGAWSDTALLVDAGHYFRIMDGTWV